MSQNRLLSTEAEARAYVERLADPDAFARLERYNGLLLAENQEQNLISRSSETNLWLRHIADSAQLLECVPESNLAGPWLDLGTGPGLPGLVVAILRPQTSVVLVESRKRRVDFLARTVEALELNNCRIEGIRLEQVEPFAASVISARAFAPLEKLLRLSAPFSTSATSYVLPKGRSAAHELEATKASIRRMFHVKHSLTDVDAGIIVNK